MESLEVWNIIRSGDEEAQKKLSKLFMVNQEYREKLLKLAKEIVSQRVYQKMGMTAHGNDVAIHAEGGFDMCEHLMKNNPIIDELLTLVEEERLHTYVNCSKCRGMRRASRPCEHCGDGKQ